MAARVKNKRPSDRDTAEDMLRYIREEMREDPTNLGVRVLWLARAKRAVQRRVLDALRGPKQPGAPKKVISDEDILREFEGWREDMEKSFPRSHRPSERADIRTWLLNTGIRSLREEGKPFRPESPGGKAEVRRFCDMFVRARKRRKNPPKMA